MQSPRQLLNVSGQRERFFVIDRDMATSLLLSCSLILTCPQVKLLLLLPKVSVFCFFISFWVYSRRPPHPLCISSVWVDCDWRQVRLCRSSSSSRSGYVLLVEPSIGCEIQTFLRHDWKGAEVVLRILFSSSPPPPSLPRGAFLSFSFTSLQFVSVSCSGPPLYIGGR